MQDATPRRLMSTKLLLPLITAALAGSLVLAPLALAQGRAGLTERPLPDGAGKAAIEGACAECHAMALVTNSGHTPQDWQLLVERMINVGAKVPADQVATASEYLAKNFPERDVPKAGVVPGNAKVTFQGWDSLTPGPRP